MSMKIESPSPVLRQCAGAGNAPASGNSGDRVAVLLCTRRGGLFLHEQLESVATQSHANWRVYASDDASDDETRTILVDFQRCMGRSRLQMRNGPGRGFTANFLSLACDEGIEADYFAFCDQDDVWEPDKLARALAWLAHVDPATPALYCCRTRLIDEQGHTIGYSPLFSKAPHFRNAIVQSIAGGNTMVFNAAARRMLIRAGRDVAVPAHDWWLYILVTAMGGMVRYDFHPSVRYRVHGANAVGANCTFRARLTRIRLLLQGRLRTWTDMHATALLPLVSDISPEGRKILIEFLDARRANAFRRIVYIYVLRIYRQTLAGNIALFFAFLLRKA